MKKKVRHPGLARWGDEQVKITTREDLDLLLALDGEDRSESMISFGLEGDTDPHDATTAQADFVASMIDQIIAVGSLPAPREPLPPVGTRVEVIMVGGKPPPPSRFAVGVVRSFEWCTVFRTWRINVDFDNYAGKFYGNPVKCSSTFSWLLHVIGSEGRPFSTMTPDEIEDLYQERRDESWRRMDPKTGLSDPAGRVPPRGEER